MNESKVTMLRAEIDAGAYDPHGLKAKLAGEKMLDEIANSEEPMACRCELRDRQWNPVTGRCENCGRKYFVRIPKSLAASANHHAIQADAGRVRRDETDMRGDLQRPDLYEPT